jgi:hypothetical protein
MCAIDTYGLFSMGHFRCWAGQINCFWLIPLFCAGLFYFRNSSFAGWNGVRDSDLSFRSFHRYSSQNISQDKQLNRPFPPVSDFRLDTINTVTQTFPTPALDSALFASDW